MHSTVRDVPDTSEGSRIKRQLWNTFVKEWPCGCRYVGIASSLIDPQLRESSTNVRVAAHNRRFGLPGVRPVLLNIPSRQYAIEASQALLSGLVASQPAGSGCATGRVLNVVSRRG